MTRRRAAGFKLFEAGEVEAEACGRLTRSQSANREGMPNVQQTNALYPIYAIRPHLVCVFFPHDAHLHDSVHDGWDVNPDDLTFYNPRAVIDDFTKSGSASLFNAIVGSIRIPPGRSRGRDGGRWFMGFGWDRVNQSKKSCLAWSIQGTPRSPPRGSRWQSERTWPARLPARSLL